MSILRNEPLEDYPEWKQMVLLVVTGIILFFMLSIAYAAQVNYVANSSMLTKIAPHFDITWYSEVARETGTATIFINTNESLPIGVAGEVLPKERIYGGELISVDENGEIVDLVDLEWIQGRGNGTWYSACMTYGKFPFNFKVAKRRDLLDIGANPSKSWVLLANNNDQSLLRNQVAFEVAREADLGFVPQAKTVNFYNNGEYYGSYLLTEKVDVGKHKLLNDGVTVEDNHVTEDITVTFEDYLVNAEGQEIIFQYVGVEEEEAIDYSKYAFLLELDYRDRALKETNWFRSPESQYIAIKAPDALSQAEMEFIAGEWAKVESAVYNENYEVMQEMMDLESFAKVYLLQEFAKALDAGVTSYFVYYSDEIFKAMPIWDYDWSFGNSADSYRSLNSGCAIESGRDLTNPAGWFAKCRKIAISGPLNRTEDGGLDNLNFQAMLASNLDFWDDYVHPAWQHFFLAISEVFGSVADDGKIFELYSKNAKSFAMNEAKFGFLENQPNYNFVGLSPDEHPEENAVVDTVGSLKTMFGEIYDDASDQYKAYRYLKRWGLARAEWLDEKLR